MKAQKSDRGHKQAEMKTVPCRQLDLKRTRTATRPANYQSSPTLSQALQTQSLQNFPSTIESAKQDSSFTSSKRTAGTKTQAKLSKSLLTNGSQGQSKKLIPVQSLRQFVKKK